MINQIFGKHIKGNEYQKREAVYALCMNEKRQIPLVKTHLYSGEVGYFLIGGGIEIGESHQQCLKRECLEEAGINVEIQQLLCKGECYYHVDEHNSDYHAIGYFYIVEVEQAYQRPLEVDFTLVWLDIDKAHEKLFLPHQKWAVEIFGKSS